MFYRPLLGALLAAITISVIAVFSERVGAAGPPSGGVIEVTGYQRLSIVGGSQGPVTVVVHGQEAKAVRRALAGLTSTSPSNCLEKIHAFSASFVPHVGARPTYVATEIDCPTPGVVTITGHGITKVSLKENCALKGAVISALPNRAEATKRDANLCSG